ncbi:MAG: EAL domain-containing protein, partial [Lachnospiraceae bacterium]|nr:EAL domain-containing protein [Lachnospiraceae bacterium]
VDLKNIDIALAERSLAARDTDRLIFGMKRIAGMNVSISIKNFGSCFASVGYMNRLPVETFVFDSKWLEHNLDDGADRRLVKSIIRLTKDAHKNIVAYGFSDRIDRAFLTACGCDATGDKSDASFFLPGDYSEHVNDKLSGKVSAVYDFNKTLCTDSGNDEGSFTGDGVSYTDGVTKKRGALYFSGGPVGENTVELPCSLFSKNSYTIALWINPEKEMNWSSVVYARFDGGFISLVPYTNAEDGISVFRISEDEEGFFDTSSRAIMINEWSHICICYDAESESVRMYINGRKGPVSNGGMPMLRGCRKVLLGGDPFQKSYVGSISSLCIYNYALSGNEVKQLYESYTTEPGFKGFCEEYWMDTM